VSTEAARDPFRLDELPSTLRDPALADGGPWHDPRSGLAGRTLDLLVQDRSLVGRGSVARVANLVAETGARRAFVVTDPGVAASGVAGRVVDALRGGGIEAEAWEGVQPNPGTVAVGEGGAALAAFGAAGTAVVPVGGGSSMDTAKALALHATNPGIAIAELGYDQPWLASGLPIVAVVTTAGTGAETNSFGVIIDETVGRKIYIGHPTLLPRAAILDPDLTLSLPHGPTGATGVDAMTHSLESLLSRNPNPFAEAMALGVIRTVATWLPRALADGSDIEARSQLLLASHLAGLGQASGTGVGLVHAIGHALGTHGRLPHGTSLAAVIPEVLAFYGEIRTRELALVGVALGVAAPQDRPETAAAEAIAGLDRFLRAVGQRRSLRELGVGASAIPILAQDAIHDAAINNAPRLPTAAEVTTILESVAG
jgi:alcohol dehydrogenase